MHKLNRAVLFIGMYTIENKVIMVACLIFQICMLSTMEWCHWLTICVSRSRYSHDALLLEHVLTTVQSWHKAPDQHWVSSGIGTFHPLKCYSYNWAAKMLVSPRFSRSTTLWWAVFLSFFLNFTKEPAIFVTLTSGKGHVNPLSKANLPEPLRCLETRVVRTSH